MADAAQRYLRAHVAVNCKPRTMEFYRSVIDRHIVPALGGKPIGAVRRGDIAALHHALHDRPAVANSAVQVFSQLYRKAQLWGLAPEGGNPWVITGEAPGKRLMTLKSTWRRVKLRAGLRDVRLHDLRHSYATRALALGESLTMIGKLLNHAQMQSTARYAHIMADAEKDAAARVGDRIAAQVAGRRAAAG